MCASTSTVLLWPGRILESRTGPPWPCTAHVKLAYVPPCPHSYQNSDSPCPSWTLIHTKPNAAFKKLEKKIFSDFPVNSESISPEQGEGRPEWLCKQSSVVLAEVRGDAAVRRGCIYLNWIFLSIYRSCSGSDLIKTAMCLRYATQHDLFLFFHYATFKIYYSTRTLYCTNTHTNLFLSLSLSPPPLPPTSPPLPPPPRFPQPAPLSPLSSPPPLSLYLFLPLYLYVCMYRFICVLAHRHVGAGRREEGAMSRLLSLSIYI